ncbi:N-acetylneuraminate synthase [Phosphitispora fastidiosa]|uniref:N-acetylneuraminate synthase n=1 Tax=Phosphitispora fastidiosa TaxID=2837202 RepID=UPI001E5D28E8|nr:N-acetylneuraminate synthase [Phosphitispora fastidiosa]MBU7008491.1 N-acetylneuraminate synthase [Phosphitispora fastidiosa]
MFGNSKMHFGQGKVYIIAEAGVNHNGSLAMAKELIESACQTGADAVKFQTWKTENVITRSAPKTAYQLEQAGLDTDLFTMLKRLELSYADFAKLKEYCDACGTAFLSTADEYESAAFLNTLQEFFKIGSAELTDWPFLRKVAAFGKPVLLSTGMSDLAEISAALKVLSESGLPKEQVVVLHANTEYPTPFANANLLAIRTIAAELGVRTGYSDHTPGIEAALAAAALGACVIEKHFTLNRELPGPDHKASIEPTEFRKMVSGIRKIELALGTGVKAPSPGEKKNIPFIRKSIVALKPIRTGETFSEENITVKRPGFGISPIHWDQVIGQVADRNYEKDDFICL